MEMRIKRLHENAIIPKYATSGAAGMDLHACISAPVCLPPGERFACPTGIAVQAPRFHEAQVRPRSGLALKEGLTVLNAPGTVDSDYTGEVKVILINHGDRTVIVKPGDRIAQMVICPVMQVRLMEVDSLEETERGAGGFGSTGK